MKKERLKELLGKFSKLKIGVLGDFYLDRYSKGEDSGRISKDDNKTKIFKVDGVDDSFIPGGAGNVALNVRSLGCDCFAIGVVGDDMFGEGMINHFEKVGIKSKLIKDKKRCTGRFEKFFIDINGEEISLRVDVENKNGISKESEDELLNILNEIEIDGLIVADYDEANEYGVITKKIIDYLKKLDIPVLVDSRTKLTEFKNCIVKTDLDSALKFSSEDIEKSGIKLREKVNGTVLISAGEKGVYVFDEKIKHILGFKVNVKDTTGAGDSFNAGFISGFCCGGDLEEASYIGNLVAGVTVQKENTGTAEIKEVVELYDKSKMNKAIFLDRDSTIIEDRGYTYDTKNFKLLENVLFGLKLLDKSDYKIIIITNQEGISKKYYKEEDYKKFTEHMLDSLKKNEIKIDSIYYCPHLPDGDCDCHKPKSGMFEKAKKDFNIDFSESWMIGDKVSDVEVGKNIGAKTIAVIGPEHSKEMLENMNPDYIVNNLNEGVKIILGK